VRACGREEPAHYRGGHLSHGTVNDGDRGNLSDGSDWSHLGNLGNLHHRGGDDDDARSTRHSKLRDLAPSHETARLRTTRPLTRSV
tara:strand:+ start:1554 stop:1811 length:258 start_codon:yes stop_codon:yes gene_type:complete